MRGGKKLDMSEVTDYWCDECGNHADVVRDGVFYCASCWMEKFGG